MITIKEGEETIILVFYDEDKNDISKEVKLGEGKGNQFGTFSQKILYKGRVIGYQSFGEITLKKGYTYKEKK